MAIGATRNVPHRSSAGAGKSIFPWDQERHCSCPGHDVSWQLTSWAERGCEALFYSLFGKQVCEGPGTMQRLSRLPVTRTTVIQGGRSQGAGVGLGWGEPPGPAQASLLSHLPHCSFLASQGPVEGAGCFPWGRGKNSYQIPRCPSN